MRAAVLPGVDAAFELREVPEPSGEALVRVRAAGVNFADVLIRRGRYPQMPDFPVVLGSEIAGELEDGTRVMAITSGSGGYAEVAAVDRAQLVPLPAHASYAQGRGHLSRLGPPCFAERPSSSAPFASHDQERTEKI